MPETKQYTRFVPVGNFVDNVGIRRENCQTACKPGSVRPLHLHGWDRDGHSSGTRIAARLTRPTRAAGRDRPCVTNGLPRFAAGCPYSVLLPVGFTLPPPSPGARCALAAPFHPCPHPVVSHGAAGGLFSVALSLESPPPAVSRHRVPVEPGLSSTLARTLARRVRGSGRPAVWQAGVCACGPTASRLRRSLRSNRKITVFKTDTQLGQQQL